MSRVSENTAKGTASQRGGQQVHPETYRDTNSMEYKKPYQIVGKPAVVGDLNDEYMRHPVHNESGPKEKGVWKKLFDDSQADATDPRSEVPKGLENSVGEGGIGSVIGRQRRLDQEVHVIEEGEI